MFHDIVYGLKGSLNKLFKNSLSIETPKITLFIETLTKFNGQDCRIVKENQTMDTECISILKCVQISKKTLKGIVKMTEFIFYFYNNDSGNGNTAISIRILF